ncbi:MAG: hypothetical protein KBT20_09720 [Bacteroidales bacterium]|nr:hypothetical protein [Candidatus Liminaster caballi]
MKTYIKPAIKMVEIESAAIIAVSSFNNKQPNVDDANNNFAPSNRGNDWADYEN